MSKYGVTFTKKEYYEVEANSLEEAEDKGFDMLDADKMAFMDFPVDEVEVKPIRSKSMGKLLRAFEDCAIIKRESRCVDCPYKDIADCKFFLYDTIRLVLDELSKYIEFKDIRNIKDIVLKEDNNESKD